MTEPNVRRAIASEAVRWSKNMLVEVLGNHHGGFMVIAHHKKDEVSAKRWWGKATAPGIYEREERGRRFRATRKLAMGPNALRGWIVQELRDGEWRRADDHGGRISSLDLDGARDAVLHVFWKEERQAAIAADLEARQDRAKKTLATHGGLPGVRACFEDRQSKLEMAMHKVTQLRAERDVFEEAMELAPKLLEKA